MLWWSAMTSVTFGLSATLIVCISTALLSSGSVAANDGLMTVNVHGEKNSHALNTFLQNVLRAREELLWLKNVTMQSPGLPRHLIRRKLRQHPQRRSVKRAGVAEEQYLEEDSGASDSAIHSSFLQTYPNPDEDIPFDGYDRNSGYNSKQILGKRSRNGYYNQRTSPYNELHEDYDDQEPVFPEEVYDRNRRRRRQALKRRRALRRHKKHHKNRGQLKDVKQYTHLNTADNELAEENEDNSESSSTKEHSFGDTMNIDTLSGRVPFDSNMYDSSFFGNTAYAVSSSENTLSFGEPSGKMFNGSPISSNTFPGIDLSLRSPPTSNFLDSSLPLYRNSSFHNVISVYDSPGNKIFHGPTSHDTLSGILSGNTPSARSSTDSKLHDGLLYSNTGTSSSTTSSGNLYNKKTNSASMSHNTLLDKTLSASSLSNSTFHNGSMIGNTFYGGSSINTLLPSNLLFSDSLSDGSLSGKLLSPDISLRNNLDGDSLLGSGIASTASYGNIFGLSENINTLSDEGNVLPQAYLPDYPLFGGSSLDNTKLSKDILSAITLKSFPSLTDNVLNVSLSNDILSVADAPVNSFTENTMSKDVLFSDSIPSAISDLFISIPTQKSSSVESTSNNITLYNESSTGTSTTAEYSSNNTSSERKANISSSNKSITDNEKLHTSNVAKEQDDIDILLDRDTVIDSSDNSEMLSDSKSSKTTEDKSINELNKLSNEKDNTSIDYDSDTDAESPSDDTKMSGGSKASKLTEGTLTNEGNKLSKEQDDTSIDLNDGEDTEPIMNKAKVSTDSRQIEQLHNKVEQRESHAGLSLGAESIISPSMETSDQHSEQNNYGHFYNADASVSHKILHHYQSKLKTPDMFDDDLLRGLNNHIKISSLKDPNKLNDDSPLMASDNFASLLKPHHSHNRRQNKDLIHWNHDTARIISKRATSNEHYSGLDMSELISNDQDNQLSPLFENILQKKLNGSLSVNETDDLQGKFHTKAELDKERKRKEQEIESNLKNLIDVNSKFVDNSHTGEEGVAGNGALNDFKSESKTHKYNALSDDTGSSIYNDEMALTTEPPPTSQEIQPSVDIDRIKRYTAIREMSAGDTAQGIHSSLINSNFVTKIPQSMEDATLSIIQMATNIPYNSQEIQDLFSREGNNVSNGGTFTRKYFSEEVNPEERFKMDTVRPLIETNVLKQMTPNKGMSAQKIFPEEQLMLNERLKGNNLRLKTENSVIKNQIPKIGESEKKHFSEELLIPMEGFKSNILRPEILNNDKLEAIDNTETSARKYSSEELEAELSSGEGFEMNTLKPQIKDSYKNPADKFHHPEYTTFKEFNSAPRYDTLSLSGRYNEIGATAYQPFLEDISDSHSAPKSPGLVVNVVASTLGEVNSDLPIMTQYGADISINTNRNNTVDKVAPSQELPLMETIKNEGVSEENIFRGIINKDIKTSSHGKPVTTNMKYGYPSTKTKGKQDYGNINAENGKYDNSMIQNRGKQDPGIIQVNNANDDLETNNHGNPDSGSIRSGNMNDDPVSKDQENQDAGSIKSDKASDDPETNNRGKQKPGTIKSYKVSDDPETNNQGKQGLDGIKATNIYESDIKNQRKQDPESIISDKASTDLETNNQGKQEPSSIKTSNVYDDPDTKNQGKQEPDCIISVKVSKDPETNNQRKEQSDSIKTSNVYDDLDTKNQGKGEPENIKSDKVSDDPETKNQGKQNTGGIKSSNVYDDPETNNQGKQEPGNIKSDKVSDDPETKNQENKTTGDIKSNNVYGDPETNYQGKQDPGNIKSDKVSDDPETKNQGNQITGGNVNDDPETDNQGKQDSDNIKTQSTKYNNPIRKNQGNKESGNINAESVKNDNSMTQHQGNKESGNTKTKNIKHENPVSVTQNQETKEFGTVKQNLKANNDNVHGNDKIGTYNILSVNTKKHLKKTSNNKQPCEHKYTPKHGGDYSIMTVKANKKKLPAMKHHDTPLTEKLEKGGGYSILNVKQKRPMEKRPYPIPQTSTTEEPDSDSDDLEVIYNAEDEKGNEHGEGGNDDLDEDHNGHENDSSNVNINIHRKHLKAKQHKSTPGNLDNNCTKDDKNQDKKIFMNDITNDPVSYITDVNKKANDLLNLSYDKQQKSEYDKDTNWDIDMFVNRHYSHKALSANNTEDSERKFGLHNIEGMRDAKGSMLEVKRGEMKNEQYVVPVKIQGKEILTDVKQRELPLKEEVLKSKSDEAKPTRTVQTNGSDLEIIQNKWKNGKSNWTEFHNALDNTTSQISSITHENDIKQLIKSLIHPVLPSNDHIGSLNVLSTLSPTEVLQSQSHEEEFNPLQHERFSRDAHDGRVKVPQKSGVYTPVEHHDDSFPNFLTIPQKTTHYQPSHEEDESQLQEAMSGDLARKIVNAILKKEHDQGELQKHFVLSTDHAKCAEFDKQKKAQEEQIRRKNEEALRKAMQILQNLALQEVKENACTKLTPDLKSFLMWMLDKSEEDLGVPEKEGKDSFLFHQHHAPLPPHNKAPLNVHPFYTAERYNTLPPDPQTIIKKVSLLQKLIHQYEHLSSQEKVRVSGIYENLIANLNALRKMVGLPEYHAKCINDTMTEHDPNCQHGGSNATVKSTLQSPKHIKGEHPHIQPLDFNVVHHAQSNEFNIVPLYLKNALFSATTENSEDYPPVLQSEKQTTSRGKSRSANEFSGIAPPGHDYQLMLKDKATRASIKNQLESLGLGKNATKTGNSFANHFVYDVNSLDKLWHTDHNIKLLDNNFDASSGQINSVEPLSNANSYRGYRSNSLLRADNSLNKTFPHNQQLNYNWEPSEARHHEQHENYDNIKLPGNWNNSPGYSHYNYKKGQDDYLGPQKRYRRHHGGMSRSVANSQTINKSNASYGQVRNKKDQDLMKEHTQNHRQQVSSQYKKLAAKTDSLQHHKKSHNSSQIKKKHKKRRKKKEKPGSDKRRMKKTNST